MPATQLEQKPNCLIVKMQTAKIYSETFARASRAKIYSEAFARASRQLDPRFGWHSHHGRQEHLRLDRHDLVALQLYLPEVYMTIAFTK